MPYNVHLADRVRELLVEKTDLEIQEKEMFSVLNFLVNNKTCICVSGDKLMLRFDPKLQEELSQRIGYEPMFMKGKVYIGYCYLNQEGFRESNDFEYAIQICLDFNNISKKSKMKVKKRS
jgi:hypothetical protein